MSVFRSEILPQKVQVRGFSTRSGHRVPGLGVAIGYRLVTWGCDGQVIGWYILLWCDLKIRNNKIWNVASRSPPSSPSL